MTAERVRAILDVLGKGREPKIMAAVLAVFGASSLEECYSTYHSVGAAERATLNEAVERVTAKASTSFLLSVDNKLASPG